VAVDDHGLEVIRKSGEEVTPGDKSDYYIKVAVVSSRQFHPTSSQNIPCWPPEIEG
jgi:hypothetical protein